MEKLNLVNNGLLRLPPGFRFHPTDEELVVQYLKRKVQSCPLPASIIPDADVCKSDPWDLPGCYKQERFFFSRREIKYPTGVRSNRATQSGYWKATGLDKQVTASGTSQVVGMKKTLVFYKGKPPTGSKTDWIMHEYRLVNPKNPTLSLEKWVLCRIFLKKRGSNSNKEEETVTVENESKNVKSKPIFFEFLATPDLNLAPGSSSSGSSGITYADGHEHEESSTNRYNF
ncbi:hypothetical protein L1987_62585 [Smallanthus sonchifolius]|uniref:Uncharacterized protein n=1 Tax=Smallanthus sonchifolius TaxID=185202 RepID=A0ACB9CB55_9ASTR|nr:hypothetical protein L1987_62585 [Smallanthus sonchifolius]